MESPSFRTAVCRVVRTAASAALVLGLPALFTGQNARAQWVQFADETSSRIVATASLGVSDVEEKDYAWGDVDHDNDLDLVVVRKQPFTSPGKRVSVLFLNENGVLVDRTTQYATDTDVSGDLGFNTPTNTRDVLLVDLNNDGWLDIVTAVTISDGDPKHIGHPRIYRNKGEDGGGNWLGFRFENFRIPAMTSYTGQSGFNPRFCSVAAGDVTGDGYADLWFGDYDSSGAGGNQEPAGADFEDRLLINLGTGAFKDQTQARLAGMISIPGVDPAPFEVSAFGAAAAIEDMNGDGVKDIVKQTSLNEPLYVGIAYNEIATQGLFDTYEVVNDQSPYFVTVGDLNNDNKLDMVITDDGADRYLLNQGNGPDGLADFVSFGFSFDEASDDGFGSDSVIADLNNDGWDDVLITDVDVDISGCTRRMHIYRNLGGTPGGNVTLQEQTTGTGCATSAGNPSTCVVASIPSNKLEGVHDVAVFDINDDGWLDLVVGRCTGTEVYINQPPVGLTFSYPQGLPFFVNPGTPTNFQVQVNGFGGAQHVLGSADLFLSIDGGPFNPGSLTHLGGGLYQATLPGTPCTSSLDFYFTADKVGGGVFNDPATAPATTYKAIAALGTEITFEDSIEGSVSGWSVVNDPSLSSGAWQQAVPIGTISGGQQAAPSEDAENIGGHTRAFVTQNGVAGGAAGSSDIDGGPTDLLSPVLDLAGTDATVSYSRWFFATDSDVLTIWVTGNGTSWTLVETVSGLHNAWEVGSFRVGDFITPTATVRVRFRATDSLPTSITEAAIDAFRVEEFVCAGCSGNPDCADGLFCNGVEICGGGGVCGPGSNPCPGQQCNESTDACVQCLTDAHCNDGNFCNGAETCAGNVCVAGSNPCPGEQCDENGDQCVECLTNAHCDDGAFCNGLEACSAGACTSPGESCPGRLCDEDADACIGNVPLQPRMGRPLLGLTGAEHDRFVAGSASFNTTLTELAGLGPVFNQASCGACHNTPLGGSGTITVTRFGYHDEKGGGFDSLDGTGGFPDLGGSLRQAEAIRPECAEIVPPEANVTTPRLTNSTLGFGLVEAVSDADIQANATAPPPGVSGRVHMVEALENPGTPRVGRFGWKAQVATVLTFSADASRNEMGLTNRFVTTENDPNGVNAPALGAPDACDTIPDPEDGPDGQGLHFIDRVTNFQRLLAPPPQTPRSGMAGENVFNNVGCASCHMPSFTTPNNGQLEAAIRNKTLKPYSDFLLHDMGLAADFIEQGGAAMGELRTPPLWGVRVRDPLWHDGRVAGGTFASRVLGAIAQHDALNSEAQASAQAFAGLLQPDKDALVAFLNSLGRAEFDQDGDGDVDAADYTAFQGCFTGPGSFYGPDDACSVSDVDQDGDVDDDDFDLFLAAAEGQAGEISTPLAVGRVDANTITLSWGDSCASGDLDYEVYEGTIGAFGSHVSILCSTAPLTSTTVDTAGVATYYLVVPHNGFREGSYGTSSTGIQRPRGAAACLPQSTGACQ